LQGGGLRRMKYKHLLITCIILLMSCILVIGVSVNDYKPGWFESYEGNQSGILYNFWHSLDPFALPKGEVNPYDNADIYGWYNNTFFGLANWEREVCLVDLSPDVRNIRNVATDTALEQTNVYSTTITVSSAKQYFFNNTYLYEVSWYIMPFGSDALYRVYLKNNNDKEYFAGTSGNKDSNWVSASQFSGAAGYDARYTQNNFDKVVLEYRDAGSSAINEMVVSVVDKSTIE
jgi:hypothetical protein